MILWVFIEFFGVKIVITDIYRYFTDIYRYFTDIFSEIPAQARMLHSRDFTDFSPIFPLLFLLGAGRKPIFLRYIGRKNRFFCP